MGCEEHGVVVVEVTQMVDEQLGAAGLVGVELTHGVLLA